MMKFPEAQLEAAFVELLGKEQFLHVNCKYIVRWPSEMLLLEDLREYLHSGYSKRRG